jgi:hypothetical protein
MEDIYTARGLYGQVFATTLQDGSLIPWKALSVGDVIHYSELIRAGIYPLACIEDEIFKKCVVDGFFTNNIHKLKAGTVSTVAGSILEFSSPVNLEQINYLIEQKRFEHQAHVFHQMVGWICQAFPSYKPEDIYAMDYEILLLRLVQAEEKLLRAGILKEPFKFFDNTQTDEARQSTPQQPPVNIPPQPPKRNVAKEFRQQQQTVITKADILESRMAMDGHSLDDVEHSKVANETAMAIYPEYMEQVKNLKPGEKFEIPPHEERMAAAEEKAKLNKAKYDKAMKQKQVIDRQELQRLKKVREEERKRRARRKRC